MKTNQISVKVKGLAPIMFDKFYSQSKGDAARPPKDKFYLNNNIISLPVDNIWAFLTCQRTGCIRIFEGKAFMDYYRACQSFIRVTSSDFISLIDDEDKPIEFDDFKSRTYIYTTNVIVGTGKHISRNVISRPVLNLPWSAKFDLLLIENDAINIGKLKGWIESGGILIGLGNGRPRYGRFVVVEWDEK